MNEARKLHHNDKNMMTRSPFFCLQSFCRLILSTLLLAPLAGLHADQPSILRMYADNLGYGELGCYSNKDIQTPRLDRFAKARP
jgi:arylsulfatase A